MTQRASYRKTFIRQKRAAYLRGLLDARAGTERKARGPLQYEYTRGQAHGRQWFPRAEPVAVPRKPVGSRLLSALERWIGRRPSK